MIYKTYGSTGIKLSAIGFGGMRFENLNDPESSAELIKAAYDAGINYFDTAPGYCDDKSEIITGMALREMKATRSQRPYYVSTKSSKTEPEGVRKDVEESLKRLGVDCIDFFHLWCIKDWQEYERRKRNGVLDEFEKLKSEGLIKHICVSTHLAGEDIGRLLRDYPFDGVLLGYSAMNFAYREKGLTAAAELNQGVAVMNPLGGGIIPQHAELFDFLRTRSDQTVVEAALGFLLNDPRITLALVGFSSQSQLDEAISAVKKFQPLTDEQLQSIRQGLSDSFDSLCTLCRYCDSCPCDIEVPELMDCWNHLELTKDSNDVVNRMRYHWTFELDDTGIDRCTHCGRCEQLCTQKLPITDRMAELDRLVKQYLKENPDQSG